MLGYGLGPIHRAPDQFLLAGLGSLPLDHLLSEMNGYSPGRKVSAHLLSPAFDSTSSLLVTASSAFLRWAVPQSLPAVLLGGAGSFWGKAGTMWESTHDQCCFLCDEQLGGGVSVPFGGWMGRGMQFGEPGLPLKSL